MALLADVGPTGSSGHVSRNVDQIASHGRRERCQVRVEARQHLSRLALDPTVGPSVATGREQAAGRLAQQRVRLMPAAIEDRGYLCQREGKPGASD